jgi:hypothetical protein
MEAECSPEILLLIHHITKYQIPEDCNFNSTTLEPPFLRVFISGFNP